MPQDTNVNNLIINKLTKTQYDTISSPSSTELYFVTDDTGLTAGAGISINQSTATISLADNYGDTKNPYGSKTQKYVLAAPNAANGVPSFRALVASDIPALNYQTNTSSYAGGTAVTLNNASKASSTASFYAPTSGGTSKTILVGNGTSAAPVWSSATTWNGNAGFLKVNASGVVSVDTTTYTTNTGTVTGITAGTGLNTTSNDTATDGGTISSSGTLYLTKSGVTAGTKGATADVTGNEGNTIKIPQITVDKYGRVTGLTEYTYTSKNTTYTVGNQALKIASNTGTTTTAITMNESSADKTLTLNGDNTWIKGKVEGSAGAVTVTFSHDGPSTGSNLTTSNGTASAYALNTEYTVITGVTIAADSKGHITGVSTTRQKIKDTNTTYSAGTGLSLNSTEFSVNTSNLYWANQNITSASSFKTTPEVANIRINGNTSAAAAAAAGAACTLTYNSSTKALDFNFV